MNHNHNSTKTLTLFNAIRTAFTLHKAKKASEEIAESSGESVEIENNDDGEEFFKVQYRRLTVRTFKGKTLVDIREMYKDKSSGALKPGSKGISLTAEQVGAFLLF
nr:hypothetical protein I308_01641 [Cryptococcus tetragattii IND107]